MGIDDEFYGEDVKCFAVLNEDNEAEKNIEQSIINFARERLGVFKAPVSVDFLALIFDRQGAHASNGILQSRYLLASGQKRLEVFLPG